MLKNILLKIQKATLSFDSEIVKKLDSYTTMNYEPIFIVGAPRSGSTLFFQLFTNNYKVGYISNIMALFPRYMIKIKKLFSFIKKDTKLKESDYGFIPGLQEPSEAGAIFRFYFEGDLNSDKIRSIRGTFFELSKIDSAPLVSKNLYNSLRIKNILKVFPNAKFIIINRDILYNAQSLYQSRIKHYDDDTKWFSVEPDGYTKILDKPPLYQVLWQVDKINKDIKNMLSKVRKENIFEVNYEQFCSNPSDIFTQISKQFKLDNINDINNIKIKARNKINISQDKWKELESIYVENFKDKK